MKLNPYCKNMRAHFDRMNDEFQAVIAEFEIADERANTALERSRAILAMIDTNEAIHAMEASESHAC